MKFRKAMPRVDESVEFSAVLERARQMVNFESRGPDGQLRRRMAIILPSRQIGLQESLPSGSARAEMVQMIEKILPSDEARNVVAIAFNDLKGKIGVRELAEAIPFLGFLMGFSYVGHNVVVFEGHPSALAQGLAEADVLLADSEMTHFLQRDWVRVAFEVMRTPKVYVVQPGGQVQQVVRVEREQPKPEQPKEEI